MKDRKTRQIFGLFVFVVALLFYFLSSQKREIATVQDLSAGFSSNGTIFIADLIPLSANQYYVCGDLKSENSIWFQIDVFNNEGMVVGRGNIIADIPPGKFCKELVPLSSAFSPGRYRVEVLYGHDVIGATEFRFIE